MDINLYLKLYHQSGAPHGGWEPLRLLRPPTLPVGVSPSHAQSVKISQVSKLRIPRRMAFPVSSLRHKRCTPLISSSGKRTGEVLPSLQRSPESLRSDWKQAVKEKHPSSCALLPLRRVHLLPVFLLARFQLSPCLLRMGYREMLRGNHLPDSPSERPCSTKGPWGLLSHKATLLVRTVTAQ